jgi:hypothetical protein
MSELIRVDLNTTRLLPELPVALMPARHLRVIAEAVLEAKNYDPLRTASGLLSVIEVLMANENWAHRNIIATLLRELAETLETGTIENG